MIDSVQKTIANFVAEMEQDEFNDKGSGDKTDLEKNPSDTES